MNPDILKVIGLAVWILLFGAGLFWLSELCLANVRIRIREWRDTRDLTGYKHLPQIKQEWEDWPEMSESDGGRVVEFRSKE